MDEQSLASAVIALEAQGDVDGALRLAAPLLADPTRAGRLALLAFSSGGQRFADAVVTRLRPQTMDIVVIILSALCAALKGDGATARQELAIIRSAAAHVPSDNAERTFRFLETAFANTASMRHGELYRSVHFDLVTILSPALRAIFDLSSVSTGEKAAFTPIPLHAPRPAGQRTRQRVVVAIRERFYPSIPNSRLFEAGPRIAAGCASYGWEPAIVPLSMNDPISDWTRLEAAAPTDSVLILDHGLFSSDPSSPERAARLQGRGCKLVFTIFDPWAREIASRLGDMLPVAEQFWSPFPTVAEWQDPAFRGKVCLAPFPTGFSLGHPGTSLPDRMTFLGSVQPMSWPRKPWLVASERAGIPLVFEEGVQTDDGNDCMEGYRTYMHRLRDSGIAANPTMRIGGSRPLTGRLFEALLAGALLVQEEAPDAAYYFEAGRHYLSFRTLGDLAAVWEFISDDPDAALAIRNAGYEYAHARYGDEAIIGDLDHRLFGS